MDELGLFTLALGLSKPWQVSDLKFSKEDGRLDLWIDFVKGSKFPCPSCEETKEGEVTFRTLTLKDGGKIKEKLDQL